MPTELVKRINLDLLYLPFVERLLDLLASCRADGADFYAICGFRNFTEQNRLYFQGRTQGGPKVTNAMGGESSHNFGLAVDLSRDANTKLSDLQPDWRAESYEILRDKCKASGLSWGGLYSSPDRPHVQFPGYDTAASLVPLRKIWKSAPDNAPDSQRLLACHQYLDALAEHT